LATPLSADERVHRDLLLAALEGAIARWHEAVRGTSSATAGFAPLGEALAWAVAIATVVRAKTEPLYAGAAHARNIVLHGDVVVSLYRPAATGYGSGAYGSVPYGGGLVRKFLSRADLPKLQRSYPNNEAGYGCELAEKDVDTVLARVLEDLSKRLT